MARRLFVCAVVVFGCGAGLAAALAGLFGAPAGDEFFPPAFIVSSLLLAAGSLAMQRSLTFVRRERQPGFRRSLMAALTAGGLFVGVQGFGLWRLLRVQNPEQAETGAATFVFVFAFLHGLHFTVALLFLSYVAVQAMADRYDHEYHWGVTVCTWFWHVLGIVWLAILGVFLIVA